MSRRNQPGHSGPRRPQSPSRRVDKIRAPYGFVPLNPQVVFPEWGLSASRDLPFADGINGNFRLEIEAVSPIFIRDAEAAERPFQLPDGMYGIPGTSVRGMLRNVIEIATFGKLSRVNDHRYTLRDLHNHKSYVSQMARIVGKWTVPLVNAGWLVPGSEPGTALLHPCHFAKIEYARLVEISTQAWGVQGFDPGRQQSAVDKYLRILGWPAEPGGRPSGWTERRPNPVRVGLQRIERPFRGLRSNYGEVTGPGEMLCHVVMTGQPSPYVPNRPKKKGSGNPKHHDFVFHGSAGSPIVVAEHQLQDFELAHSNRGQQNNLGRSLQPNAEWGFWRSLVWDHPLEWFEGHPERGVPVFFLLDERGDLRAMGLAMMFRLGSCRSVREAIQNHQPDCDKAAPDFAETLFGTVPDERRGASEGSFALAGRVSFGVARALGAVHPDDRVGPVVLSAPKASYYPSYLEQGDQPGAPPRRDAKKKPDWKTWMEPDALPRGWKRYRPIEGHQPVTPPHPTRGDGKPLDLSKVGTSFCPLPAGTRFELDVRLHNVRPVELGAILWALDHGGSEDTYHKLGLARSLGYGTICLRASGLSRLHRNDGVQATREECIDAFRQWIDRAWRRLGGEGPWEESRIITELRALARPMPRDDARHMRINGPNEFQQAKLRGLVLDPSATEGALMPPAPGASHSAASPRGSQLTTRVPSPTTRGRTPLPSPGQRVRVRISGQNKRGRWRAELLDGSGTGTLIQGDAPGEVTEESEHEVVVIRASGRAAIELGWE